MKKKITKKIFICATEQSGDNIGKNILKELSLSKHYVCGVGGEKMKPFMHRQIFSLKNFQSMGIIEIIFSIPRYIKMINKLSKYILENNFDLIITIDSPDFNYPLCKKIKNKGFNGNMIQIVAPTVWAWREGRAKKYSKIYNEIFTLFSFENKYFEKYNLRTTFIGHPIFEIKKQKNYTKKDLISFLPGSRLGEIKSLFNYFNIAYYNLIESGYKNAIFIPTLPHLKNEILYRTRHWKLKKIISTDKIEIEKFFSHTKYALVCSGTASLEIAKRGIPQLVIYKLNYLTELIVSFFIKIKFANILNIIENKMIIPEIVNSNLKESIFTIKFNELISNNKLNNQQVNNVNKVLKKIEHSPSPYKIATRRIKSYL